MKSLLSRHKQAFQLVINRMLNQWQTTLLMFCVIGITLCLPSLFYVVTDNLNPLISNVKNQSQISVFLKKDTDKSSLTTINQKLSKMPEIKSYQLVSKDEAWQKMQSSNSNVTATLEKNPLPDAFFIQPQTITPEAIEALQKQLESITGVDKVLVDGSWIKRLTSLLKLGNQAILVLASLLGFALLAVIGNSIRMQMLTQHDEIEVSKLIGATNSFIRCPFLYAGALYGLGGGLVAGGFLTGVLSYFNTSISQISAEYGSQFMLYAPTASIYTMIALIPALLGWAAAYFAVGRALAEFK